MFSLSYQFYPAARAFAALTTDILMMTENLPSNC